MTLGKLVSELERLMAAGFDPETEVAIHGDDTVRHIHSVGVAEGIEESDAKGDDFAEEKGWIANENDWLVREIQHPSQQAPGTKIQVCLNEDF
jgi:hypothetical protein